LEVFADVFGGRRVLVTGHTGFKGAWLTAWLGRLGAEVTGFSLPPETNPNLFDALKLKSDIRHFEGDVADVAAVEHAMRQAKPDIVLHLAAQALVRRSYTQSRSTFETNVMGTVNVLEAFRTSDTAKVCVVVTSDKCYENREQQKGYVETDAMGGHDPYSASKGCAELVVSSYRRSFFHAPGSARLASARAGNVIGGGDWSQDRIVTDFVSSVLADRPISLRNPKATRPWQHVLEPLSGYLHLAATLWRDESLKHADGWNFGPHDDSVVPVVQLAQLLCKKWGRGEVVIQVNPSQPHEAGLLMLDSTKARTQLGWLPAWNVDQAVEATVEWYRGVAEGACPIALTDRQLDNYCEAARAVRCAWATKEGNSGSWTDTSKTFAGKSWNLRAG
jgi:CDP-glucose 4,6-dehydratase